MAAGAFVPVGGRDPELGSIATPVDDSVVRSAAGGGGISTELASSTLDMILTSFAQYQKEHSEEKAKALLERVVSHVETGGFVAASASTVEKISKMTKELETSESRVILAAKALMERVVAANEYALQQREIKDVTLSNRLVAVPEARAFADAFVEDKIAPKETIASGSYGKVKTTGISSIALKVLDGPSYVRKPAEKQARYRNQELAGFALLTNDFVQSIGYFSVGGTDMIALVRNPGQDAFDTYLAKKGDTVAISSVLRMNAELTKAAECAFKRGFYLCDIKPENLMFAEDGTLRVIDAGGSELRTGDARDIGTSFYASHKRLSRFLGNIDRCPHRLRDVKWAIGVTMLQFATGKYLVSAPRTSSSTAQAGLLLQQLAKPDAVLQDRVRTMIESRAEGTTEEKEALIDAIEKHLFPHQKAAKAPDGAVLKKLSH